MSLHEGVELSAAVPPDGMAGFTLWFTGLPGSGKSTLAREVRKALMEQGRMVEVLDGDEVRAQLGGDLGFSKDDRDVNVRRIGYMARLLSRNGVAAVVAAVSPYRAARDDVRHAHEVPFIEVYLECAIEELVRRDSKRLYERALRGDIQAFTGVSDPYEAPLSPELHIRTDLSSPTECLRHILNWLVANTLLEP